MWDTDYGNYDSFDEAPHWSENFTPTSKMLSDAEEMYRDFLDEVASVCHLDTDGWDSEDYSIFRDFMDL